MTDLDTAQVGPPVAGGWVPNDSFADRLARVRRHQGWNYAEASEACGFARQNWRLWEVAGQMPRDKVDVAAKIAERTGCDFVWLLTGDPGSGKATVRYSLDYSPDPGVLALTGLAA